jgi:hypothetical protein
LTTTGTQTYLEIELMLSGIQNEHVRHAYGFLDVLGDVGGLIQIATIALYILVGKWTEF